MLNLLDLDERETAQALAPHGVDAVRARRVFARVHRAGARAGAGLLDGVVGLARAHALAIAERAVWPALDCVERRRAADGFVKYLFRLSDGPVIEAVRIPLPDPAAARALKQRRRAGELLPPLAPLPTVKYTVCVSSQAGCALACAFCATGRLGGIRSLETCEILAQVRQIAAEADQPVRGIVFMGMGEPLLNYDKVMRAARILSHPAAFAIAAKAISISTAGVVPAIRRYTRERHRFRLVISLGAPRSALRARLMPIERRWPLPELMDAVRAHATATGQRVAIAYVAIGGPGGNMHPAHAHELAELLGGLPIRLTLIDVVDDTGAHLPPSDAERAAFLDQLAVRGIPFVRRYSGGADVAAACGTLAGSQSGGVVVA